MLQKKGKDGKNRRKTEFYVKSVRKKQVEILELEK